MLVHWGRTPHLKQLLQSQHRKLKSDTIPALLFLTLGSLSKRAVSNFHCFLLPDVNTMVNQSRPQIDVKLLIHLRFTSGPRLHGSKRKSMALPNAMTYKYPKSRGLTKADNANALETIRRSPTAPEANQLRARPLRPAPRPGTVITEPDSSLPPQRSHLPCHLCHILRMHNSTEISFPPRPTSIP